MRVKSKLRQDRGAKKIRIRVGKSAKTKSEEAAAKIAGPPPSTADVLVKTPWQCVHGYQKYEVKKSWWVDDTRKLLVVFECPWRAGEWAVVHFTTNVPIVHFADSKEYALKLLGLVWPRLNLAKLQRDFWIDTRDAVPEVVQNFLQHVWRANYLLNELPTVTQWEKSNLGLSHQKWTHSRGKMMVRKRK